MGIGSNSACAWAFMCFFFSLSEAPWISFFSAFCCCCLLCRAFSSSSAHEKKKWCFSDLLLLCLILSQSTWRPVDDVAEGFLWLAQRWKLKFLYKIEEKLDTLSSRLWSRKSFFLGRTKLSKLIGNFRKIVLLSLDENWKT